MDSLDFLTQQSFFFFLLLWTIPWKGVALWKAARARRKIWYIVLLLTNTAAILDILYIFYIDRRAKTAAEDGRDESTKP
jgi:uncharacterized membrane protein